MHRIGWRGDKIKVLVETPRLFVFCMHRQGAYPRDLGRLQRPLRRISE
jgi:hypothetical protein